MICVLSVCMALLQDKEDEPVFEEFYNKYNKLVYYTAMNKLKNHEHAQDCVQDVFIGFAKNFHNIKGSLNDNRIEGLVRVVSQNTAIDIYRKSKRHIVNIVEKDISDLYDVGEKEFDVCDKMVLEQAINSLPEEIKAVFYMKYVFDYSGSEIAQMLGITEALVRKRCMVGRQLAKKFIESEENE